MNINYKGHTTDSITPAVTMNSSVSTTSDVLDACLPEEIIFQFIIDPLLTPTFPLYGQNCVGEKKLLKKTVRSLVFVHTKFAKHILPKQYEISLLFPVKTETGNEWISEMADFEEECVKNTIIRTDLSGQRHGKKISRTEYLYVNDGTQAKLLVTRKKYYCGVILSKIREEYRKDLTLFYAQDYVRCLDFSACLNNEGTSHIEVNRITSGAQSEVLWNVYVSCKGNTATSNLSNEKYEAERDAVYDLIRDMLIVMNTHPFDITILDLKRSVRNAMGLE